MLAFPKPHFGNEGQKIRPDSTKIMRFNGTSILYILLLALVCKDDDAFALTSQEISQAEEINARVFPSGKRFDSERIRGLSDRDRSLLIAYLQSKIQSGKATERYVNGDSDMLDLALLGDDAAVETLVKYFSEKPRGYPNGLLFLKDPKVISMIGELLFKNEQYETSDDVTYLPTQYSAALVILHTLGNSPSFNADVINWARGIEDSGLLLLNIEKIRAWYRANESKLKAGDFKAVQPGTEPLAGTASAAADGPSSAAPGASQPGSTPAPSPGASKTQESSGNVYACIAALLLVICGGLAWLLKRNRI